MYGKFTGTLQDIAFYILYYLFILPLIKFNLKAEAYKEDLIIFFLTLTSSKQYLITLTRRHLSLQRVAFFLMQLLY